LGELDTDPPLRVLIVAGETETGRRWADHLSKAGMFVDAVQSENDASLALNLHGYDIIVLDVDHCVGSALAIADLAAFRRPDVPVISVSHGEHFTDGSLFCLMGNARAQISACTPPEDLSALVEHYGHYGRAAA
jgi:DNA-binding NtrC family response regulator